jgi:hypothetical protein
MKSRLIGLLVILASLAIVRMRRHGEESPPTTSSGRTTQP